MDNFVPVPLIIIDKPHGITSMTVVRVLRRILKPVKVTKIGYAGTLDPCATGLLVLGIGRQGTQVLGAISDKDKEYETEIDLLKDSYSGDMDKFEEKYQRALPDGQEIPGIQRIQRLIDEQFIGEIKQIPPTLSAIKINGQKACDMVRQGLEPEMKPRTVRIFSIDIISYEFPILTLRVKCSKGTYIRTLGQDIGRALNLWGTLRSLRRTQCGEYTLKDALTLDSITLTNLRKC